nr:MAG TPA: hypothetical protein [Caudoviricetes sp.]
MFFMQTGRCRKGKLYIQKNSGKMTLVLRTSIV